MIEDDQPGREPPEDKVRLLSRMSILQALPLDETRDLARRMPDIHLDRGQILHTPKYRRRMLFLILKGRVRLYEVAEGREFTLLVARTGDLFGEMSFADEHVRGVYADALEPTRISIMSRDVFDRTVMRWPEVGLKMVDLLSERLGLYGSRLADVGIKEVYARLAALILRLVAEEGVSTSAGIRIPTRYTHYQLGTMIGANRESTTNAMIRLRREGAVTTIRRYIHVKDIEALKRIAGMM